MDDHWTDRVQLKHKGQQAQVTPELTNANDQYTIIDPTWEKWASHHAIHHCMRRAPAQGIEHFEGYLSPDDTRLRGAVTFGDGACGAPDAVHPGALNLILDDALGALFLCCGEGSGFTANMKVSHGPRPLPPGRQATITAQVESVEPSKRNPLSRKVVITGRITSVAPGGWRTVTHATARLLFVSRKPTGVAALVDRLPRDTVWTMWGMMGHAVTVVLPALGCGRRRPGRPALAGPPGPKYRPLDFEATVVEPGAAVFSLAGQGNGSKGSTPVLSRAGSDLSLSSSVSDPSPEPGRSPVVDASGSIFHWSDVPTTAEVALAQGQAAVEQAANRAKDKGTPMHLRHAGHLFSRQGGLSWHEEGVRFGQAYVTSGVDQAASSPSAHPTAVMDVYLGTRACGHVGIVHGGLLAGIFQDAGLAVAWSLAPGPLHLPHSSISVDYRRPAAAGRHYLLQVDVPPHSTNSPVVLKLQLTGPAKDGVPGTVYCEANLTVPRAPCVLEGVDGLAAFPSDPAMVPEPATPAAGETV